MAKQKFGPPGSKVLQGGKVQKRSKDEEKWPKNSYGLIEFIDAQRQGHQHEHSESNSLQQLFYQRPAYSPETLVGSVISYAGLKKLGFSIVGEAIDAAVNRVAKPV